MTLSTYEVQQSLLVLGLTVRTDVTFGYFAMEGAKLRDAEVCRLALQNTNDDQVTKVREILTQYATVEYDTDNLKTPEGLDSAPARLRRLCCRKMADTIGYVPPGGGSVQIRRA